MPQVPTVRLGSTAILSSVQQPLRSLSSSRLPAAASNHTALLSFRFSPAPKPTCRAYSSTATPPPPRSRLRRFIGFTSLAVFAFIAGGSYQTLKTASGMMDLRLSTDEETLSAFIPGDEFTKEVDDYIRNHPLAVSLREDPAFTESRPHLKMPAQMRARSLTGGTLAGPEMIVVPPLVFCEEGGKSLVSLLYLGPSLCGHPGIVHGGLLATLLDEAMGRCCFPALPNRVGVTANLNLDYRLPAMAGNYVALRAETVKVEGRKAWVEARIETLPEDGKEPKVLVEAKALFIEPKQAAAMSSLYNVTA
ncbi:PaaI family thioesterase [Aspergillus fijiensis CBS 313.89]|uniref:Thioesterase/thiol ester dehydrase-isomerase n=1 Tax=Aspergillus fijiensis CBS 313.89 TaxID=1448319 RepID=A0A8G1W052_9EURO|nr:Thioesterase/thiol ester dehydrase-isomerase [Aspergillus fijiensis CBS 313.89]RAK78258.1 Thioesterase/thiol ester dehydrase-isomerase [Aspergillus fijiensis CBS 313.89]